MRQVAFYTHCERVLLLDDTVLIGCRTTIARPLQRIATKHNWVNTPQIQVRGKGLAYIRFPHYHKQGGWVEHGCSWPTFTRFGTLPGANWRESFRTTLAYPTAYEKGNWTSIPQYTRLLLLDDGARSRVRLHFVNRRTCACHQYVRHALLNDYM